MAIYFCSSVRVCVCSFVWSSVACNVQLLAACCWWRGLIASDNRTALSYYIIYIAKIQWKINKYYFCWSEKTKFNYSSQLQTWLQIWFSTRFAARFSTSWCGFATRFRPAFDFFVENLVANRSMFAGSCAWTEITSILLHVVTSCNVSKSRNAEQSWTTVMSFTKPTLCPEHT